MPLRPLTRGLLAALASSLLAAGCRQSDPVAATPISPQARQAMLPPVSARANPQTRQLQEMARQKAQEALARASAGRR